MPEPAVAPPNVRITATTTASIVYAWDTIPCGSRGGSITYKYSLDSSPPKNGTTPNTHTSVSDLTACAQYEFNVRASNSAGDGVEGSVSGDTDVEGKCMIHPTITAPIAITCKMGVTTS